MDLAVSVESGFSMMTLRRKSTWYSVCDGNWNDVNTWMSNRLDKKIFIGPQAGDDVYINHTVTCNVTLAINNLYISGKLLADNAGRTLTVNGDLQATGPVDFTGSNIILVLSGVNNAMTSFTCGALSTVNYSTYLKQTVLPFTYWNLSITNGGSVVTSTGINAVKSLVANLTVNNNLSTSCILNTNGFDISVGGGTNGSGVSVINSTTNILFIGLVNFGGGSTLNIVGAASVECRGSVSFAAISSSWSTANVNFTTNNQTITTNTASWTVNNITITGAITVNIAAVSNLFTIVNGVINGTVAGSTFTNNGALQLTNTTLPMATGIFNYRNSAASTMYYNFNGPYTLPYTLYENLQISGTGAKTASGNTTINGALLTNAGILELSTFDLTVTGTTSLSGGVNPSGITKSGAGNILLIGAVIGGGGSIATDLSGGNPTIEVRGGITFNNMSGNWGTGAMSFTTNNQSLLGNQPNTFNGPVTIGSGVTVTSTMASLSMTNVLTGIDATSIFINSGAWLYGNATAPMVTGKLYCNQATNTTTYNKAGNQDITVPTDPVSPGYKNLTLSGSGAKKLLGNVSVKGVYTLTGPATLNSNGFALTNP